MKLKDLQFQEYISLGYLYLVILGILGDVIYYKFFDITILSYTSITDVLLSPVNILFSRLKTLIAFVVVLTLAYIVFKYIVPRYQSEETKAKHAKAYEEHGAAPQYFILALFVFSMFMGFGIGRGQKISGQIADGDFTATHELTFSDDQVERIKVIGQNSMFIFYARENDRDVMIAPLQENIRRIRLLE